MGHDSALVIGNDAPDQIAKYQHIENIWPHDSRHIVARDCLAEARRKHAQMHPTPVSVMHYFKNWAKVYYGIAMLMDGETADFLERHRWGWFRLDRMGEVVEMYRRVVPYSQWNWFDGTIDWLVLKPGASGWRASRFWEPQELVLEGAAGIARKDAIDFEAMRNAEALAAGALWDSKEFRRDPLLALPRQEYVRIARDGAIFKGYGYVLKEGEMLEPTDPTDYSSGFVAYKSAVEQSLAEAKSHQEKFNAKMNAMLESLPDETILTAASVKQ